MSERWDGRVMDEEVMNMILYVKVIMKMKLWVIMKATIPFTQLYNARLKILSPPARKDRNKDYCVGGCDCRHVMCANTSLPNLSPQIKAQEKSNFISEKTLCSLLVVGKCGKWS